LTKLVQVIWTEERRGKGTEKDPARLVPQLWTLEGQLICEAEYTFNEPLDGSGHFEQRVNHDVLNQLR
jgi:hypothetical protein